MRICSHSRGKGERPIQLPARCLVETTGGPGYIYGHTFSGSVPTDDEFYAFFAPGTKNYATFVSAPTGVAVSYTTSTGPSAAENSPLMIAQPTTSTFTITESEPVIDGSGFTKVKVRATFTGKVISTGNATQTTVTNGIFVGAFKKS